MGSTGFLPKTSATPSCIGDYTDLTYPNPLTARSDSGGAWVPSTATFAEEVDPKARAPGDLGDVVYQQREKGNYYFN